MLRRIVWYCAILSVLWLTLTACGTTPGEALPGGSGAGSETGGNADTPYSAGDAPPGTADDGADRPAEGGEGDGGTQTPDASGVPDAPIAPNEQPPEADSSAGPPSGNSSNRDGAPSSDAGRTDGESAPGAPPSREADGSAEPDSAPSIPVAPPEPQITLTIKGEGDIGVILDTRSVPLEDGDTVLDVTKRATRQEKIPMEYRGGSGALSYVEGIDDIYEFDYGPESGWLFYVNGERPNRSAGSYGLSPGDAIEWIYVVENRDGETGKEA